MLLPSYNGVRIKLVIRNQWKKERIIDNSSQVTLVYVVKQNNWVFINR